MNHAYRLVWSDLFQRFVAVPETARSRGKRGGAVLLAAAALSGAALAGPTGGAVSTGSGTITQSGNTTTITQGSQNMAINWASFNVGSGESVKFVQPGASSIALNRVLGTDASSINGSLTANGQVWILNPNGVLFGNGASVNVGGLLASTLRLSDSDFQAGKATFAGNGSQGSVVNQGSLTGGYVALIGKQVSNSGTITTPNGTAALAAGDKVTLDFSGSQLLSVTVDEGTLNALAENKGLIRADNGSVLLSANAKNALMDTVVNNEGVIEARGIDSSGGRIILLGGFNGGTVKAGGTLDASSVNHDGGFIETSGAHVQVADGAQISTLSQTGKTGTWLVDPTDFTISLGSGAQTGSGIGATTLAANLASNNVTLTTDSSQGSDSGEINVNAAVSWSANTTLTLNAYNNINLYAEITATGANAGLVLNTGNYAATGSVRSGADYSVHAPVTLSGANASLQINGAAYTLVHSMADLEAINSLGLAGRYALAQDIDASANVYGAAVVASSDNPFTGSLAGLGHGIKGFNIADAYGSYLGLFAATDSGSVIRDVSLQGGRIGMGEFAGGNSYVGALVGYNSGGTLRNVSSSVEVSAPEAYNVGGLAGFNTGTITGAEVSGSVTGNNTVGGLAGFNGGTVSDSVVSGSVTGRSTVGGLLGSSWNTVSNAYAVGAVHGDSQVGGLVGLNAGGNFNLVWDSNATGQASAWGTSAGAHNVNIGNAAGGSKHSDYAGLGSWHESAAGSGFWVANGASGQPAWVMFDGMRPVRVTEYTRSIHNARQLQLIGYDLGASYVLANDIDASATGTAAGDGWGSEGFMPLGNAAAPFTGSLAGASHSISGLVINRAGQDNVGLVGTLGSGGSLSQLDLNGGSVTGHANVGGLVGWVNSGGTVSEVQVTGSVTGSSAVGGLAGQNLGIVGNSEGLAVVSGGDQVGGLVGNNDAKGAVLNSSAAGLVSGGSAVGGLVGWDSGALVGVSSGGSVSGTSNVGGLVGTLSRPGVAGTDANGQPTTVLQDLTISNVFSTAAVTGATNVGGLVGWSNATLSQVSASGGVVVDWASGQSAGAAGGLVGRNAGSISNAQANGVVLYGNQAGGLVGINDGSIVNAHADGSYVQGGTEVGGLVGRNNGSLSNVYAGDGVYGDDGIGGLAGSNAGSIVGAYATGFVRGYNNDSGGLVGSNTGVLSNVYASGTVSGAYNVGGLVGSNSGSIASAYAAGDVGGYTQTGGLVGRNAGQGQVGSSFWLKGKAGTGIANNQASVDSLTRGLSDAEARSTATYTAAGWSLDDVGGSGTAWRLYEGSTMPLLRSFLTPVSVSFTATGKVYDGQAAMGTIGSYTLSDPGATLLGSGPLTYASNSKNAGGYSAGNGSLQVSSGLYSTQQGYDIAYSANLAIGQAALIVFGAHVAGKTYDGTSTASVSGGDLHGLVDGDSVALSQSGSFGDKNAGTGKTVTESFAISGGDAGNYLLVNPTATAKADIAQAPLTVSGSVVASKTYDGSTQASVNGGALQGLVQGDSVSLGQSASFADKNAGSGKTVNEQFTIAGTDARNYLLANATATTTADITAATLTVSGSAAANKTYDGTALAQVGGGTLAGVVAGDSVTLSQSGTFADKNAGLGKVVTVTNSLGGDDAGNYVVASDSSSANIAQALLTVTGAKAQDKVFDGTKTATVTGGNLTGLVAGDDVALSQTGQFVTALWGHDKPVVETFAISGADAQNYQLTKTQQLGLADVFKPATLTVAQRLKLAALLKGLGLTVLEADAAAAR
ncbi:MAG TPA: YDG domain-containing protein [Ideonella sp.]|uniref:YDG domain-containing protein n=1 Tax=Ideonella sp. TaxID=1929293 RepID=UPI002CD3BCF1|nr:YDG domain-containing protein [Ideonella sp.]HSI46692.1 YDG domain-containing protein [Ideonella sp.]